MNSLSETGQNTARIQECTELKKIVDGTNKVFKLGFARRRFGGGREFCAVSYFG